MEPSATYRVRSNQEIATPTSTDPQQPSVETELKAIDGLCGSIEQNLQIHEQSISPVLRPVPPSNDTVGRATASASPLVEALREVRSKLAHINSHVLFLTERADL